MSGHGINKDQEAIREMIDHRLKSLSAAETVTLSPESHLDEDTISAFVEGRLATNESRPILSHLTACGLCRRASAHLVRLENQVEAEIPAQAAAEEPGRLRAFLSDLTSVVKTDEEVVFAYQNPLAEDEQETSDASSKAESDTNKTGSDS